MKNLKLFALTLFTVIFTLAFYKLSLMGYGYNTFGFMISNVGRFDDFYNIFKFTPILPLNEMQYTPFVILFGRLMSIEEIPVTLICILVMLIMPLYLLYKNIIIDDLVKKNSFFIILLFSHAFLFAFFRGNPVLASTLFVMVSIMHFYRGYDLYSIIFLLIASFIHPLALIYSILFFNPKYLKKFFIFSVSYLILNLIFYISISDINLFSDIKLHFSSLERYKVSYIFGTAGDLFNNSIFLVLKVISKNTHLNFLLNTIFIINIGIIIYCLYIRFKYDSFLFLLILPVSTILFSPVSADYRLLYLFIPLIFLIKNDKFIMACYFLIIIFPKNLIWYTSLSTWGITINSFINPFMLSLLLIYLPLYYRRTSLSLVHTLR